MSVRSAGLRPPTVSQLRAFLAVAEHLHFREAASAIGMSQPALSGAVAALEEILDITLVERTTRRVLLTPAGERLAGRARAVLDAVGELMEEAEAARAPFTGALRLGVIPTCAPYLLPTVLRLVREKYPALDLAVTEDQTDPLLDGLLSGRLDVLLLAVPLGVTGLDELPLFDEDICLVTPADHPLAGRGDIPREALRDLDLILLDQGHCLRDQALEICRGAGRDGQGGATSAAGLATLVQLVAGGMGATLLPRTALDAETARSHDLATGHFTSPAPTRRIALVTRSGAARATEFAELGAGLREALRALPVRVVPAVEPVRRPRRPAGGAERGARLRPATGSP
ncbi:hydrogen peroxide-inducible genes activator [Streptomyces spiramenti]|uniref:hydrogen peroxide-inducible genes activator n=1 Tax=Streptomyces spiramenti TaxID=2720606 RepID=UPI00308410A0